MRIWTYRRRRRSQLERSYAAHGAHGIATAPAAPGASGFTQAKMLDEPNEGSVDTDAAARPHIADNRTDALHKLTTNLTRRFHTIGIENLMRKLNERHGSYLAGRLLMNVRGMRANESLARSIADMNFFEYRKQLKCNSTIRDGSVVVADRWFAGS